MEDTGARGIPTSAGFIIPASELRVRASRAGGPGGQHVNTSSTRVEVIWRLSMSRVVTPEQRERIAVRLASRLDAAGNVRVVAGDTRSQRQNRLLAESRLAKLVTRAVALPKPRRATRPTHSSVERRLADKRMRSDRKDARRRPDTGD